MSRQTNPGKFIKRFGEEDRRDRSNSSQSFKKSYNESYNLLERPQIPPTINSNSSPSQNTALFCLRQIPIYYIPEDYSSANSMYPGTYPLMFSESSIQESSLPFLHLPRILEDHQLFCHQSHT